jgi:hypothetical protein
MSPLKKLINRSLFEWQRRVTNVPLRNMSINILGTFIGRRKVKGTHFLKDINVEKHCTDLEENGFTKFGVVLNESQINELKAYLKDLDLYNTYKPADKFTFEHIPADCNVASFQEKDLVKSDLIVNLINDEALLEIVRRTLGATPTISDVGGWWSIAGRKSAKDAQLFHRDVDDFKFLKLFIYLTDVTRDTGPHIYVAKSHNKNVGTKIRRYSVEEVETMFGKENVMSFEEPKGSVFLVNTFGMHKGLLPVSDNRLLIQIQYSTLPVYVRNYSPLKRDDIKSKLDPYVNRLIIDFK